MTLSVVLALLLLVGASAAGSLLRVETLLPRPGDMHEYRLGKVRIFKEVEALRDAAGEAPSKKVVRRLESEAFVEEALVRISGAREPAAQGVATAVKFANSVGARSEMKAELRELTRPVPNTSGNSYFRAKRFRVPQVPQAVGFALLTDKKARRLGVESGVAKALFIEGRCLLSVGIVRPASEEVLGPVKHEIRAVAARSSAKCP